MKTSFPRIALLAMPILTSLSLMTVSPSAAAATPVPPDAEQRPHTVEAPHGAKREDVYYWLRDDSRQNPEVIAYLDAENAYADTVVAPLRDTREKILSSGERWGANQ